MIVTEHFVYIHLSRTGGTFLNKLILSQIPEARMLQYHGHLEDLPSAYSHLPVLGFVRNPWDWYVSMFNDYSRKRQFVFQILSDEGTLDFSDTITRYLNLGDGSASSRQLLRQLSARAPETHQPGLPDGINLTGLKARHFACFPAGIGYYGWLFELMFRCRHEPLIRYGQFENLREDALRLFEETGVKITKPILAYLRLAPALNQAVRPQGYADMYCPALGELLAAREQSLIEKFGYQF